MNFYEKLATIKTELNKQLKKQKDVNFEIIEEVFSDICFKNKIVCILDYSLENETYFFNIIDFEKTENENEVDNIYYLPKSFFQNIFSAKRYFYQSLFDIPEKYFIKIVYSDEDKKKIKKVADLLPEDKKEKYRQLMKENVEAKEIFYQIAFDFANMNS